MRLAPLASRRSPHAACLTPLASRRSSHAAARRYAPPLAAGSNPTQWIEANKGGITADVRDALLREKEKGEVQASAKMAPGVLAALDRPGSFHSPATDVGARGVAWKRLEHVAAALGRSFSKHLECVEAWRRVQLIHLPLPS